ncbi:exostosin family protein [Cyanobium sp. Copco_Reservoir_LC18]|uniref:exostosin domain-containing protein n=1 Tax=Cyanobium sp. Copco_Reservoir_LC18 TaxID=1328305 RepID=UPI00135BF4C1|nr:exostosin family protein [Cyanobium sp. Copco_Reservoir_LC18]
MRVISFDSHWQEPAKTEKAAYKAICKEGISYLKEYTYFAFPWASLIDAFQAKSTNRWELLAALRHASQDIPRASRVVTVCQHIYAFNYIELFASIGVTDLFWPHKLLKISRLGGVNLYPFPLYPVQECPNEIIDKLDRKYIASFIGAFNPKVYLTEIRQSIFDLQDQEDEILIIKRDAWHYDRAVYAEQVQGINASQAQRTEEAKRESEYRESLRDSWFCLCPSGSGPNSIRIFEALSYGSIPIVLADDLDLSYFPKELSQSVLVRPDSKEALLSVIKEIKTTMTIENYRDLSSKCKSLYPEVAPKNYAKIIGLNLRAT